VHQFGYIYKKVIRIEI